MEPSFQPAAQLLPARLRVLSKPGVEVGHLGADLVDARQPQRLARCLLQLGQGRALLARERLQVAQGGDDVLRAVTGRDEVDQAAHLVSAERTQDDSLRRWRVPGRVHDGDGL